MLGISPTCYGCIDNEEDLALVIQGVFDGNLRCIERRPYEAEKAELVGSGNIFVFNEERSGIKRWTDGFSWSPSRISGKFLVYREYNKLDSTQDPSLHTVLDYNIFERSHQKYVYTGLLKKTFSLKYCIDPTDGSKLETFHLVAYYKEQDIHQGSLKRPSENPFFNKFQPSQKLTDALKKVAVGNGRSNPTRSSERDRAKLQNTGMRRSLSSSSTYNDFVKTMPFLHEIFRLECLFLMAEVKFRHLPASETSPKTSTNDRGNTHSQWRNRTSYLFRTHSTRRNHWASIVLVTNLD